MSKIVCAGTAKTFEAVYKGGYDKMYPSIDLVRLESWYFKKTPGRSLDYGCGPGTNGLHLLDAGYEVVFTDVSREALKKVEEKLHACSDDVSRRATVRPINLSADNMPDEDESYDYVLGMSVLGGLESRDSVQHLLHEFYRILRPNGKVIVDISSKDTTYVHDSSEKISDNVYKTIARKGFDSDDVIMFFPDSSQDFAGMVEKPGFVVDDVGHSSFAYLGHMDHEYIVCAHKPG